MVRRGIRVSEIRTGLRAIREENPVWSRNRPGKWGRAQAWTYYGSVAGGWALAVAAHQVPIYVVPRLISPAVLAITLLQCLGGYALVSGFAGLGARPRGLEDLALTRLSYDEIVYGTFDAGIRQALWLFLPLQVTEVVLVGVVSEQLYLVLILLTPVQWVVLCRVLQLAVGDRSRMRSVPTGRTVAAFVWVLMVAGSTIAVFGLILGFLVISLSYVGLFPLSPALLLGCAVLWWPAHRMGRSYLDEAHAEAVGNFEDFINGDRERA